MLKLFSPHTRGCSVKRVTSRNSCSVFPAHAGMFRGIAHRQRWKLSFPRTRGDVPILGCHPTGHSTFSPHTRGCSLVRSAVILLHEVFPAHAGMFRFAGSTSRLFICFPRTRGDVPIEEPEALVNLVFSPHTRGCSVGTESPRIRCCVFPAHAGMFPPYPGCFIHAYGFPRTRGDVPEVRHIDESCWLFSPHTRGCSGKIMPTTPLPQVFPAHAGMFRRKLLHRLHRRSFPRTRGDVPAMKPTDGLEMVFSPHTRGCSTDRKKPLCLLEVFPAHAGMFLGCGRSLAQSRCFPRTRGDVPLPGRRCGNLRTFSPHTRGCSAHGVVGRVHFWVFPAHAGMFLSISTGAVSQPGFPRTRGDVPNRKRGSKGERRFSPHTRGCS